MVGLSLIWYGLHESYDEIWFYGWGRGVVLVLQTMFPITHGLKSIGIKLTSC